MRTGHGLGRKGLCQDRAVSGQGVGCPAVETIAEWERSQKPFTVCAIPADPVSL